MIEHVCRLRGEGQIVSARSSLIKAPRAATATAQATRADSATSAATASTTTASAAACSATAFYLGANANHFTYAHVQTDIGRPGAETVGDDLFVGAEGIRIKTAIFSDHHICFAAARGKSRPSV